MTAPRKLANSPTNHWLRAVADDKRIPIIHRLALLRFGLQPPADRVPDIIAAELGIERGTVFGAIDAAVRRGYLFPARPGEFIPTSGPAPPTPSKDAQPPPRQGQCACASVGSNLSTEPRRRNGGQHRSHLDGTP